MTITAAQSAAHTARARVAVDQTTSAVPAVLAHGTVSSTTSASMPCT